jgi:hypothetical protein
MQRADRRPIEPYEAATLEDAIDDRLPEILVVQHAAPRLQCLVRCKDHGPVAAMPFIHDVKEHVRRVGAVGEVAHFVDHQDGGMRVRLQRVCELTRTKGGLEVIDERRRGCEEGVEAILDRAIGDRDRQVCLPAPGFAREDERAPLSDKVRRER